MNFIQKFRHFMLPLSDISKHLQSAGLIYELGCGQGVISTYVAQQENKRQVVAIDKNRQKIAVCKKHNGLKNLDYKVADISTFRLNQCRGVVMSDFLHHVSFQTQEKIIKNCCKSLKKDGSLVIKEIDKQDGFLTLCSRVWDFLLYPHDSIYYRSNTDWTQLLKKNGLTVVHKRAVWWFPGSTHLFICNKS